ncbi:uncharacterized protein LOC108908807 isoform X2 [Anoplophora glabripennis]|uniref:uncharacterized protein LOC108908807 isoform X2 n=1 Tax=Anoplophora glabripennis TaxID=217634 RepID=UPI0008754226|nr:uncharacterized protein LOC108908807 isoform X2 [Anoplophora glabripennis]
MERIQCGDITIVIDDFDSAKTSSSKEMKVTQEINTHQPNVAKPYTRQSSDASIKKILEEAEVRKQEFWKLIDEHNAVIENLKRIEKLESTSCKVTQPPIRT